MNLTSFGVVARGPDIENQHSTFVSTNQKSGCAYVQMEN